MYNVWKKGFLKIKNKECFMETLKILSNKIKATILTHILLKYQKKILVNSFNLQNKINKN